MVMKRLINLIIFFFILSLIGSNFILAATSQKIKIRKENEVEVIYNPKKPEPPAGIPTRLILEEEFTIGRGESEATTFSQLVYFAVDSKGIVYALDSQECVVKVFDNQGKFLRSFGRKGQGPGEMNLPVGLQITPASEIVIEDPLNQRLVYFSPEGSFLKTTPTAKVLGLLGLLLDTKGNLIGRQMTVAENKMFWEVKKYSPELTPLFTVGRTDFSNPLEGKIDPFSYLIIYELSPSDYIFYGNALNYEIKVFSEEGKLCRRIIKEYDPVKITEEEKKKLISQFPDAGFNIKERVVCPDYYPPYQLFSADEEGRLLVRTYEKGKAQGETVYDVFDQQGRLISRIPLKIIPRVWKNKKLYAIEETEEGYNVLRCYRISWTT